jgi:hypothetical protein
MPKREDERFLNMAGRHPTACTCQDCTDRFLKGKKIKPNRKVLGKIRGNKQAGEKVAKHPRDCDCASCGLLRTFEDLPRLDQGPVDRGPGGFLRKVFRLKGLFRSK